ncbi:MAG: acyltransferase, partial [Gluconacetobacter diazotrophicus]|nr:acyltransferase [Gluconacetobacter diazotrophicus]
RHNNFDALRLFAAIIVIYGHGWGMTTSTSPPWWGNGPIARLGLDIFFSISGYLVTRSWDARPELAEFAAKRALRLMPGLVVCTLMTAFVLGPAVTTLPLGGYLVHPQTWSYLWNIGLYLELFLPGVFPHQPDGGAVNGSLWSLCPEVLCYCTVAALGGLPPFLRRLALLTGGLAAGGAAVYLFQGAHPPVIYHYSMLASYALQEVPYFCAGALLSLLDRNRDGFYRADIALGLFAAGWGLSMAYGWKVMPIDWLAIPYLVIGFGRMSLPVVNRGSLPGDLSYGTYLYAFPMQQLVLLLFPHAAHPILLCVAATLPVAWLSWHLVERPGLALRGRLRPAIGAAHRAERRVQGWFATMRERERRLLGALGGRRLAGSPWLPLLVATAILAAYAGQLPMGRWQTDEYQLLLNQRQWGLGILPVRLSYSPRPVSELVLFGYGWVVLHAHLPLVAPFLAALWGAALGAMMAALRAALPPGRWRWPVAAALPAALFGFALVTDPVTEFFFWPAAAAAYLPTATAAAVLLFLLARPADRVRDAGSAAALLVAALSSEMGAAFAIGFGGAAAVEAIGRPGTTRTGRVRLLRSGWWWWAPALAGIAVLVQIARVRVHVQELGSAGRTLTGHPVAAATAALVEGARDVLGFDGTTGGAAIGAAVLLKLLFAVGMVGVWRAAASGGARLGRFGAVLAAAILAAMGFSLWGAFLHYGSLCCERQATTRYWMVDVLAVVAVSALLPRGTAVLRRAGPLLLTLALLPVLWRTNGIAADYGQLRSARDARARTWLSAAKPGTAAMQFFLPPDSTDLLIRGTSQPLGRVRVGSDPDGMVDAMGRFFGRTLVDVCQPWQGDQSWLYYGRFIPACPPHGGPPDRVYPPPAGTAGR